MPVEYKDYYKVLGVPKSAKTEDVKKAYRRLARQYHPDLNKGADAERRFKEINEAHEVLSHPEKRRRYDQLGANWQQYASGGQPGGGYQWVFTGTPGGFGEGGDFTQFSDFFRTFFGDLGGLGTEDLGRGRARADGRFRSRQQAGGDLESEVEVSLAEAYSGAKRSIEVEREDGSHKRLDVRIPAGVRDGQRIRLARQGSAGHGGGEPGDLFLKVRVRPHPFFRREGDDIHADLPIALHEAMLGGQVSVPTLKGHVSLKIPPETQNGRVIRLAGQGMPRPRGGFGDMYVAVKVVLPQKLTQEEREALERLAARRSNENVRSHLL